jgi:hypothetical protein
MTLGDISVWTENWYEQTGRRIAPSPNGAKGFQDFEEYQVG